jgi:predicted nucleic acid-binding protein
MASLPCFTAPIYCWSIRRSLLLEYQEKLITKQIHLERRLGFLSSLIAKGLSVNLAPTEIVPRVLADPDDDVVLACALIGGATHLVTYDPHLLTLKETYRQQVSIVDGLHFLYVLRGDEPPVAGSA